MRLFEVIELHAPEFKRVVDATGRDDVTGHLRSPQAGSSLDLAHGAPTDVQAGDIAVVAVPAAVDRDELEALARTVPDGAALVLLLAMPAGAIPVGVVVAALTSAGVQVVQAAPLTHPVFHAAVVARPSTAPVPFVEYLAAAPLPVPDDSQLRRLINEHLVEGLVNRAQGPYQAEQLARAEAAQADAQAEAGRQAAKYAALEASRPLAVGRALGAVRHHPVSGARQFLRAVRGGGSGTTS